MSRSRHQVLGAIDATLPAFVTRTVLFHQAVAQAMGLTATDLHCLNLLLMQGPLTPGELARSSGLTTGAAITGALDRLQRHGYVTRARDSADRRRVLVVPDRERAAAELTPLYDDIGRRHSAALQRRDRAALEAVLAYLTDATELTRLATLAVRDRRRPRAAP